MYMDLAQSIILLLVGAAVFIVGMNMMSGGLKKSTGRGLRRLLKKIRNNRFAGLGIGTAATALIQSSAATSVMAIGFINAGAMTIFQGVCIILGAYIGTTVTGLLASLSTFNFSGYFIILAVIGVILMFFKKERIKNIGEIIAGLGLLFFGLSTMSGSINGNAYMAGNVDLMNGIKEFFAAIEFPPLLMLIGALITALLQSSSATSGVAIAMVSTGALGFNDAIYIVLGATIGTVVTTIIATIGGSVNAKRTGFICLVIRIFTALVALAIYWPLQGVLGDALKTAFGSDALAVAMFLVIYNVVFMLAILPFVQVFEKLSIKLIKDKEEEKMKKALKYIDKHLLNTPSIAMMQVKREIVNMMSLSHENFKLGFKRIVEQDNSNDKEIIETEDKIDYINNQITSFLIELTNKVSSLDEKMIGSFFHVVNDIERIGDHAYNFYESSLKMVDNDLAFSNTAKKEFQEMYDVIDQMFELSYIIFNEQTRSKSEENLKKLHQLETQTDELKNKLSSAHYERIQNNTCKMENSPFYTTLVSELERVADHLVNIGYSIVNPTGDDLYDKQKA